MSVLDQFTQTSDSVDSRLRWSTRVYTDVINRLTNVQTRAAGGRSTILTQTQRDALAGEIRGAASAILTAVNTSYRGMYLFSGGQSLTPPVHAGSADLGLPGRRQRAVGRRRPRPAVQVTFDAGAILQGGGAGRHVPDPRGARRRRSQTRQHGRHRHRAWPSSAQAFDRVTNAQTQVGLELARLPEDRARLDDAARRRPTRAARRPRTRTWPNRSRR